MLKINSEFKEISKMELMEDLHVNFKESKLIVLTWNEYIM